MNDDGKASPSLLESESRGGDTAEGGFSFQEQVILAHIPMWLAEDGFTAMTQESIGDTEAKFFIPGQGFVLELLEAKNHRLTPTEFWAEVDRFQEISAGSPGTYRWFTLTCTGISQELAPLVNGLRRIRGPYTFYSEGSGVKDNSWKDYVEVVSKLGRTEQEARFLFEQVAVEADWGVAQCHGEALFKQSLTDYLPEYQDLPNRTLGDLYANLGAFVQTRKNQTTTRLELETRLWEKIDPRQLPPTRPVMIHTSIQEDDFQAPGLHFAWATFFGGEARLFPPSERWNRQMLGELRETRDWVVRCRGTRRIRLTGNRRLSASLAIGSVFSAVAGFSIEMDYRGECWSTDAHSVADAPSYPWIIETRRDSGEHLIVTVGILRDIASEVENCLQQLGLGNMPAIHLHGNIAITSPQEANVAVRTIKDTMSAALMRTRSRQVHLFFAGPAFVALLLGHRLNATSPVQCYEWVSTGQYVPSCRLFSTSSDPK